jgi:hypothetical protein
MDRCRRDRHGDQGEAVRQVAYGTTVAMTRKLTCPAGLDASWMGPQSAGRAGTGFQCAALSERG